MYVDQDEKTLTITTSTTNFKKSNEEKLHYTIYTLDGLEHENKGENSRTITQSNWAGDSIEIKITHFPQQGEMLDEHMPEIYQEKWTLDKSGKKLTIEKYGLLQTSTLEFKKQNIVPVGPLPSTSRPVKN